MMISSSVGQIEDRADIGRLISDFGHRVDLRDFRALAALFGDDGVLRTPLGPPTRGAAEIAASLTELLPVLPEEARTYHVVSNVRIDLAGDVARARSMWTSVVRDPEDEPIISNLGHYDDEFVREHRRWRFRSRTVASDIPLGPAQTDA
jgi:ketosteroid isomerase-like protein